MVYQKSSDIRQESFRESLWYKDAIIYELHVRAFRDSNGDGVGFPGLTEKLDYIEGLGANTIWLLPFIPLHCVMTLRYLRLL